MDQYCTKFVPISRTVPEIWLFFDFSRWRLSAILEFLKYAGPIWRGNMHHLITFRADQSSRFGDMSFFRFLKLRLQPSAILDF